jgi:hypothetical protein
MSNAKSKLGQNPLTGRGVGALFTPAPAKAAEAKPPVAHGEPARKRSRKDSTSVSHLVNKVTQPSSEDADLVRHTFYLTEAQGQKVKLYALLHGMQISEVVRMLVDNHLKIQP